MPSIASLDNVFYVEGLKYNLLSISQFCDNGYIISFNKDLGEIFAKIRKYNRRVVGRYSFLVFLGFLGEEYKDK